MHKTISNKFYTVIVLASNETLSLEKTIKTILEDLKRIKKILIISPSNVEPECLSKQKEIKKYYGDVIEIHTQPDNYPGYGGACIYGIKIVKTDYFVICDGDGEADPSLVKKMFDVMVNKNEIDIVNASRWKRKKLIIKDYGFFNSIMNFIFQKICQIIFGSNITDFTAGFRMYKTEKIKNKKFYFYDKRFSLENIILPLKNKHFSIEEIDWEWKKRSESISTNSFFKKTKFFSVIFRYL